MCQVERQEDSGARWSGAIYMFEDGFATEMSASAFFISNFCILVLIKNVKRLNRGVRHVVTIFIKTKWGNIDQSDVGANSEPIKSHAGRIGLMIYTAFMG